MCYFFFFSSRRRHTRCLSDWSSDVCSSDLMVRRIAALPVATGLESFLEERTGQKMTVQEGASEKCGGPMCGCEHFGPRGGKGTLSYRRGCGAIRGFQI